MGTIRTKGVKRGRIMGMGWVKWEEKKITNQKGNTKENSKTEIEYNNTIRIRLIRIFIDYVGEGIQHIGMICDWPVDEWDY